MRESRLYGFVRGALSNERPYRVSGYVASGPSVWTGRALQAESDDLEVVGLALLYPALARNVCVPGHHGYPRALDLIRVSAPKAIWAT